MHVFGQVRGWMKRFIDYAYPRMDSGHVLDTCPTRVRHVSNTCPTRVQSSNRAAPDFPCVFKMACFLDLSEKENDKNAAALDSEEDVEPEAEEKRRIQEEKEVPTVLYPMGTPLYRSATLDVNQVNGFLVVYIVMGDGPRGRVLYVGSTPSFPKRIRQHQQEIKGGAKRLAHATNVAPALLIHTGIAYKGEKKHEQRCQVLKLECAVRRMLKTARSKRFREEMRAMALQAVPYALRIYLVAVKLVLMRPRWSTTAVPSQQQVPVRCLVADGVHVDLEEFDEWLHTEPDGWDQWKGRHVQAYAGVRRFQGRKKKSQK